MRENVLMVPAAQPETWQLGSVPVAVIMISLHEAHTMRAVRQNLRDWAQEIFIVDSYSTDGTVDIALRHGVNVVQRRFRSTAIRVCMMCELSQRSSMT
jgi:hypothetical protein